MSLDNLKLFLIKKVAENKNLRRESRKYLMRYIKEDASFDEIKKFLLDENIVKINYINEFVRIGTAQIRTTLGSDTVEDLKEDYENCKEYECDNFGGKRYDLCKARCKLQSLRQNRELLEDALTECDNQAMYPESCKKEINKSLEKLEDEIDKTEDKISALQNLIET